MRSLDKLCGWAWALFGVGCALGVQAAEPLPPAHPAAVSARPATRAPAVAGFGSRVDTSVLANLNGGSDVFNNITINGSVSDTTTEHVSTGFNSIDGGAFANAVGLPMVIQNSGNSVLIQNATIVNLQMQQ
jgi:hypothetical protein